MTQIGLPFIINVNKPILADEGGGDLVRPNVSDLVSGYSHSMKDTIGYDTCRLTLSDDRGGIFDWLDYWGHDITVDSNVGQVWNGFVNKVTVSMGGVSIETSDFKDIVNKVNITYSTLSWNTNPPIGGDSRETGFDTEDTSIELYGTMEAIVNAGTAEDTAADQARALYLKEFSYRQISYTFGGQGLGTISVECLGYGHLLEKYFYTQTASVALVDVDAKIQAILAAQPDSLYNTNYDLIDANTTQIDGYADGRDTAMSLIKGAIGASDSSFNRYAFGIYEDRTGEYLAVSTTDWEYEYFTYDPSQYFYDRAGAVVPAWRIRPGRWVKLVDLGDITDLPDSTGGPFVYVQSISFTAPNQVNISGDRVSKFDAKISALGVGAVT